MYINPIGIFNEILNNIQSRLNFTIPTHRSPRAEAPAAPEPYSGTPGISAEDLANFEKILLQYLDGDRSDETVKNAIDAAITTASAKHGVEESLIRAIIRAESSFNPNVVSRAGAEGLMQLMPGTARSLGVVDSFNIFQNVEGGTRYISNLLDRYSGDLTLALAAYNAGSGNVARYGGIPPFAETQAYIPRVLNFKEQYIMEQYKQAAAKKND